MGALSITPTVTIVATPEDQDLACRIAEAVRAFARVDDTSFDKYVGYSKYERFALQTISAPVFILSRASMASPAARVAVAASCDQTGFLEFQSYYVVRGGSPEELLSEFSELEPLRSTMLVPEERIDAVLTDVARYLTAKCGPNYGYMAALSWQILRRGLGNLVRDVIAYLHWIPGMLSPLLLPVLFLLLAFDAAQSWRWLLGLTCMTATGLVVGMVQTLDVWPWLRGDVERSVALLRFERVLRRARIVQLFALSIPGFIAWWLIVREDVPAWWVGAAVVIGILDELANNAILRTSMRHDIMEHGLTPARQLHSLFVVIRWSLPWYLAALERQREQYVQHDEGIRQLLKVVTLGALAFHRPWLSLRDRVFISYAWTDDRDRRITSALGESLAAAGVEYFVDTSQESEFVPWRPAVAQHLARATHVLLVVSPNIANARTSSTKRGGRFRTSRRLPATSPRSTV